MESKNANLIGTEGLSPGAGCGKKKKKNGEIVWGSNVHGDYSS